MSGTSGEYSSLKNALKNCDQARALSLYLDSEPSTESELEISQLRGLKRLNVYGGVPDKNLWKAIFSLTNLTELRLDIGYDFEILPEEIGNLKNLTVFSADDSSITELPSSFCELKKLRAISFHQSQLNELPHNFGDLQNLEYLRLSATPVYDLPESFINLTKLNNFNISGVVPAILPELFKLRNLQKLCVIASMHRTDEISDQLGDLTELRELILHGSFTIIPASVANLKKLEILDLSSHNLTGLPHKIDELRRLEYLSIYPDNLLAEAKDHLVKSLPGAEINFDSPISAAPTKYPDLPIEFFGFLRDNPWLPE